MYPLSRLTIGTINAIRAEKLDFGDTSEIHFRCRPWDLDMFMEMNNGRIVTLYDLGRFDLAFRIGLTRVLKEKRWGLTVAGSSIQYRRRITLFEKVTMRTQAVGYDDKWVYLVQSMWVGDKPASSAAFRTGVIKKGRLVPPDEVAEALGAQHWKPELPDWVVSWTESDNNRPWPPISQKPTHIKARGMLQFSD